MVQKGGGEDGIDHQSAKHLLDSIGKKVYDKAKKNAEQYFNELHGSLKDAIFEKLPNGQQTPPNPCDLDYQWHTNATNVRSYPCRAGKEERFSQVHGGECDDKKIEGNGRNNGGACAPFRRLHLCVRNLENININKYINKDTLLADVCLAAKYEGDLIKTHYTPYQHKYDDSPSQICTMLARSFADIGDIIRGKDLYLGNKQEKKQRDKLENNLKTIFKKIHEGLKDPKKSHYNDSEGNYFQLREDWWNNNRIMVWYAMTCGEPEKAEYFRKACSGGTTLTNKKCRCTTNDVPTYFDYVPQYLRWFEEWAEDFCRKRKKKIENAIKNCRNDEEERYCSGNGYDCTQTIRGDEHFVEGDCHKCSVSCKPFVKWIDNQKLEFLKQIKKYEKEITKKHDETTTITTTHGTINNMYVDVFYNKLQEHYPSVDAFLELLSKEKICKDPPKIEKQTASSVDFKNHEDNGTFCRTKYCEPCPWCGLEKGGPPWTPKKEKECRSKEIRNFDDRNSTEIELLDKNTSGTNIVDKLGGLCNDSSKPTIQKWKCYYKKEDTNTGIPRSNDCILQDGNEVEPENRTIHSFNSLFWQWVTEMFEDSIKWRKEHENCMKKGDKSTCKKGCKKPCDCFKNWVDQKKKEWKQIEQHYVKEDFEGFGTYGTFEYLLKEDYFPKIKAPYKEVKSVQEFIIEMEQIIDENYANISNCTKDNNSIKELLEYEEEIAKGCQSKRNCPPKPQQPAGGGPGGRSLPPAEHEEDDDHPDDPNNIRSIKFPDEEGKDPVFKDHQDDEGSEDNTVEPEPTSEGPQKEDTPQIDVCKTVAKALTDQTNLTKACGLKYGHPQRHWGWKCIPTSGGDTGSTTSSEGGDRAGPSRKRREAPGEKATGKSGSDKDGATCIPPRRRKLYIHKVENDGINDDASLRDWFVKSAAVETFFLWHRYKKEKKPQAPQDGAGLVLPLLEPSPPGEDPQTQLKSGTIPPDFLRLMFYTLGDYRDLCVGNTPNGIDTVSASDQKDKEASSKLTMKQISDKIKEMLGKQSGTRGSHSGTDPVSWWNNNAKHIWHGMVCALTYKETSGSGEKGEKTTITQDGTLKDKFLDTDGKKPKEDGTYTYEKVQLKEDENGGAKTDTLNNPKLTQFVLRPPYFRYLEEWGETFCRERAKRLAQIYKDCRGGENGNRHSSGDGEDCDKVHEDPTTFKDLEYPTCARHCRSYKKWIERKKYEFTEQQKAYSEQKKNCGKETESTKNNDGNGFCVTLEENAAKFLERLKSGPCSKINSAKDKKADDYISFTNTEKTFGHETYCGPCSEFKINCKENDKCSGANGNNCKDNKITAEKIGNGGNSTHKLDMLVSDKSGNGFQNGLSDCMEADIFKGIRKDQWKCRNVCGYVVCKSEQGNGKENQNKIITIRALLHRWLEYFLEDYNKIRKKLKPCMYDGEGSKCENKCEQKCKCVGQWVEKKKLEWKEIKDRLLEQYKNNTDSPINFNVKSSLEKFKDRPEFQNGIKPCGTLQQFESFCGLNGAANPKNDNDNDLVLCLLKKLGKEAEQCKDKPPNCDNSSHSDETPTLPDDEEENIEENPVEHPKICGEMKIQTPEEKGEEKCEAAQTAPKETSPTTPKEPPPPPPSTPAKTKESKKPKSTKKRPIKRPNPWEHPIVIPSLVTSTLAWSVGIGFAAFTYFYLKKKTKSSVGNLFQILQIPKSDHDIPTKLSPNRYIPYTSGKYRGKRYIYLEGDSGTDSGYTDHYSDITSSSESEYEELDINDIYVPGSPKYKTLIEVVLEPSGKLSGNTIPTSGNNTTASGNNTTASGNNTPSDTQNDIQNDGIPSSKITDNEWNTLKDEFISNMLQNEPNTEPNILHDNLDNNTHPTMSRDNMEEKPFITSIHDRDLYSGEEYNYDMFNSGKNGPYSDKNDLYSGNHDSLSGNRDPTSDNHVLYSGNHHPYSGIDLINDSLSGDYDIYDELLKRKENELFGTNHVKQTSIHSVAKLTNSDPIHNQLELFHTWLDRHRDMCEKWENHHERLAKLKEEWENETHSGDINSGIPSGKLSDTPSDNNIHSDIHPSDIPSGKLSDIPSDNNIHSDIPYVLNTDVSIQIHMDDPKPINEFSNMDTYPNNSSMDTILEDLDKPFNEPYYYDMYDDDIYYDVNDHDTSTVDSNNMDVPSKVQIEMDVNTKLVKEKYPIADVWDI
ncbi:erythrocyte membrane protein 1 [Plasmodium falciparum RAJ116]|uniref:Erythrocyte membrane protein 1 n=1 Tax=Plasmodium falciparum RAJ116 TaxID=580058 RepID=A0A0L0CRU0_PLAFA|nr:erythrocyte membrane protein 1 [Plasmodium falciparum RAJ116]